MSVTCKSVTYRCNIFSDMDCDSDRFDAILSPVVFVDGGNIGGDKMNAFFRTVVAWLVWPLITFLLDFPVDAMFSILPSPDSMVWFELTRSDGVLDTIELLCTVGIV